MARQSWFGRALVNRRALAVLLFLGIQCIIQTAPASAFRFTAPIDMGYSPSYLAPISEGAPVYTAGDQLWVRSHYNSTVIASIGPGYLSNSTNFSQTLNPEQPTLVHTFGTSDRPGFWTLWVEYGTVAPVSFFVSPDPAKLVNLTMTGHSFRSGALLMNLTAPKDSPFYDAEACSLGAQDTGVVVVGVPATMGGGTLSIQRNGTTLSLAGRGLGNDSILVSAELYHQYSFVSPNQGTYLQLFSRTIRVGASDVATITQGSPASTVDLRYDGPLRVGRYQLRVFFQDASGSSETSTTVLLSGQNGPSFSTRSLGWTWLGDCRAARVATSNFQLAAPLGAGPTTWPRTVYLTYRLFGVEGFASTRLGVNISEVRFAGMPWNVTLPGYSIRATGSGGVEEMSVENDTVFLVVGPNAFVNYSVSLANQTFFRGSAGPLLPFQRVIVPLNVSRLRVTFFDRGMPVDGGDVRVSNPGGLLVTLGTDKQGRATFYLPTGRYNVTATDVNGSSTDEVSLVGGQGSSITLGGTTGQSGAPFELYALSSTAVAGVALNLLVFTRNRARNGGKRKRKVVQAPGQPSQ